MLYENTVYEFEIFLQQIFTFYFHFVMNFLKGSHVCNCDSLICLSVLTNVTLSVLVVLSAKINQHVSPTYFKNNLSYANLSFHTNSRLRFLAPTNLLGLQGMPDQHAGPWLLPASSLPAYGLSLSSDLDLL